LSEKSDMNPFFTVIMPLYNHEAYVGQAVQSVLSQTCGDFELVVCNDGSTDSSLEILDSFRDERIRLIDKPNGGTVSALNSCLLNARGHYVCWLSSDDLYAPGKLALHRTHHSTQPETPLSFAPFGYLRDGVTVPDVQLRPVSQARLAQFLQGNYVNGLSVCADRRLYEQYGLFDSRFHYAHDVERWYQFLARHEPAVLEGETQSFSRLGTGHTTDADMLGELDVLKLVYNQLDLGGLAGLLPVSLRSGAIEMNVLLMLCMRLFSQSNLMFRYELGIDLVQMVARSVQHAQLQGELARVGSVLREHAGDDRVRIAFECVDRVLRTATGPGIEPSPSFAEQVCRLRDAAPSDTVRRVMSRYLRQGL
jgi:teichuronic acid biosynthesis glycosyltransferase TuaG